MKPLAFSIPILTIGGCADLEMAKQAHQRGDEVEAHQQWQELADRGFPEANHRLGKLYLQGYQGQKRPTEARDRLEAAYEGGRVHAAYELGRLYEDPQFPQKDYKTAAHWYAIDAKHGYPSGKLELADLQLRGRGLTKDRKAGLAAYRELAEAGYVPANSRLGRMYEEGRYVKEDHEQAAKHYRRAAAAGHSESELRLANLMLHGKGTEKDAPKALAIYERHAAKGDPEAAYALGRYHEDKDRDAGHLERAVKWYQQAAANNHESAVKRLAYLAIRNPELGLDAQKALSVLARHAEQGDTDAAYTLGLAQEENRSYQQAAKWYQRAAGKGHAEASYRLGRLYTMDEEGLGSDPGQAMRYFTVAAEHGHADGQYRVGKLHQEAGNKPLSLRWYQAAAEQGQPDAQFALGKILAADGNPEQAIPWLSRAAEAGNEGAFLPLGQAYAARGSAEDQVRGLSYILAAARKGTPGAVQTSLKLMAGMSPQQIERANANVAKEAPTANSSRQATAKAR